MLGKLAKVLGLDYPPVLGPRRVGEDLASATASRSRVEDPVFVPLGPASMSQPIVIRSHAGR